MTTPTLPIPTSSATRRRRRHPVRTILIVLLVLVVLAAVALVIGERVFRGVAQHRIEQQVDAGLPKGVGGRFTAEIHGFSALQQYAAGRFDDVTLVSHGLTVGGAPAAAHLELHSVPVKGTGTIPDASGTLAVGQAAFKDLPALKSLKASAPLLKQGTVDTSVQRTFLGLTATIRVALTPALQGQYIRLTPTAASIVTGPVSVPALPIVRQLVPNGVSVCTASYLPPSVRLTSVRVTPGRATVTLVGTDLDLAALGSGRTGRCT